MASPSTSSAAMALRWTRAGRDQGAAVPLPVAPGVAGAEPPHRARSLSPRPGRLRQPHPLPWPG